MTSNPNPTPSPVTDRCYGIITLRYAPTPTSPSTLLPTSSSTNNPNQTTPDSQKSTDNLEVLLIHQKTGSKKPPFWAFPKGHPEEGDMTFLGAARREVLEETGLEIGVGDVLTFPSLPIPKNSSPSQESSKVPLPSTLKDQDPTTLPSTFTEAHTSPGRTRGKVVTYFVALLPSSSSTSSPPISSPDISPLTTTIAQSIQNQNQNQNKEEGEGEGEDKQYKITLQEKEIAAAQWLPTHEAMKTLFYPEGKEVLRCVLEALEREGGVGGCGRMGGCGVGVGVGV
ncbi:hypothetical protein HYFRA_00012173 [Hymenoscyphus fraxineus]|uniref:Nudix hydrolase domain-containing protein n=1 Tax=Hymenoscyphus fraxineus TaxID=746836 RepID=A0A9N9L6I6_9HELO|nr:hypothetical protein HYFRA_00012173 [Hymenoscyphus fraxineus]